MQLQSHLRTSLRLIQYELPCDIWYLQEAQLSQRGRMMFHVIEYFAKLLKVMRNYAVEQEFYMRVSILPTVG